MRKIIFRGKDPVGDWMFGNLITTSYEKDGQIKHLYSIQCINAKSYCPGIDGETIGQYTGMEDRKGDMIFEGDLFKIGAEENIFEVRFCEGCFLAYENCKQVGILGELPTGICLVIGNIYDNPELLKSEQDVQREKN